MGAQRSYFTYVGILMIIVVGLYAIGGILVGIGLALMPSLPAVDPGQIGM